MSVCSTVQPSERFEGLGDVRVLQRAGATMGFGAAEWPLEGSWFVTKAAACLRPMTPKPHLIFTHVGPQLRRTVTDDEEHYEEPAPVSGMQNVPKDDPLAKVDMAQFLKQQILHLQQACPDRFGIWLAALTRGQRKWLEQCMSG
jgi:hypothetical protein